MARTITAPQRALLASGHVAHFVRVQVRNAAGTLVDVSSVGGRNYQLGATVVSNVDTPADTATVTVRAGVGGTSIAPLMETTSANTGGRLLDVGRGIVISVATEARGATAASVWHVVFDGTIDTIAQGDGQRLVLSCRNRMLPILDTFTPATTSILSASAESMIASLLTLGLGAGAPPLVTPVASGWAPARVDVERGEQLWPAIAQIADQIGWTVRYRWSGNTPQLTFFNPRRPLTSADHMLAVSEVAGVSEASLDLSTVRNDVQVGWRAAPTGPLNIAQATDAASIGAYGARTLIINEDASSQIDTLAEANTMAAAILSDLKTPPFSHTLTHRHAFWCAELGDVVDVPANQYTHDLTQRLVVVGVELSVVNGEGSTVLRLRGAAASRTSSWLALGQPGVGGVPVNVVCRITSTTATTATVTVTTEPPGGVVAYLGGSATRLTGPAANVAASDGTSWQFERAAFAAGDREALFSGARNGSTDRDSITITEQGRDTIAILTRARVIAVGATTYTVRVSASAPFGPRAGTLTVTQVGGVTINGGAVVEGASGSLEVSVTDGDYGAAGRFNDYTVSRPAPGQPPGRVSFRVNATGLAGDTDSVDIEPQRALVPARIEVVGIVLTGADAAIRFRAWGGDGVELTATAAVALSVTSTPATGSATTTTLTVTRDTGNGWFASTYARPLDTAFRGTVVVVESAATATARTVQQFPVPTRGSAPVADTTPRIESVSVVNTGTSSTGGDLRVAFGGVNLPSGGSYRLSVDNSTFVSANVFAPATSPVTIASTVYTDGVAPPTGKAVDRARGTLEMLDAGGATVASMALPFNQFWGVV